MKKQLITLLLGISGIITANAQNFKLTVNLDPTDTSTKYYIYHSDGANFNDPTAVVDSVDVKNGKVTYSTTIKEMVDGYICNGPVRQATSRIGIFFIPNEECIIDRKGSSYYVSGSTFYKQMGDADKAVEPYQKAAIAVSAGYEERVAAAGDKAEEVRAAIQKEYKEKADEYQRVALEYLKAHNTEAGAAALLVNAIEFNDFVNALSDQVKNGVLKPFIDFEIAYEKRRQEQEAKLAEARKNIQPGMLAKDFTLNDNNGKPLALSSLRGKYVVLDFWGSWCGWCIKGMPKMKEYYAKYNSKMEILGIDCNDTEDAWKKAIAKHQLPWKHVYNPRTSSILNDFAIEGFPTKIVLDPEGKIARVIVGEAPEFYTYLDSVLQ